MDENIIPGWDFVVSYLNKNRGYEKIHRVKTMWQALVRGFVTKYFFISPILKVIRYREKFHSEIPVLSY